MAGAIRNSYIDDGVGQHLNILDSLKMPDDNGTCFDILTQYSPLARSWDHLFLSPSLDYPDQIPTQMAVWLRG